MIAANIAEVEISMQPETMSGRTAAVPMQFPFLDLKAQFALIRDEVMAAVERVMESQQFILGPEVGALEEEIREQVGCPHVFGCASGSDALLLALMALDVGPGDEVITVPFTFVATAGSIARLHAKPVFVDIDPATFNMDPEKLEAAITPRTKAMIPVHLFGLPADLDPILEVSRRHGIALIEDAAQAIGARYKGKRVGSLGTFGCYSFFPSKNLGGAGDGGLITTSDPALAAKLKLLRQHGSRTKYDYELLGINSRLDALQAAILRVKLKHLDTWTTARQRNAERYRQLMLQHELADRVRLPLTLPHATHIYHQFTIRAPHRDRLKTHLAEHGIPSEIYYPHPLHLQSAFANLGYRSGSMPESEAASREVLSLPIYPELTDGQLRSVVKALSAFEEAAPA
jgi:dTDP-4-amino-4,6-dideoxygalactose transaminase